MTSCSKPTGLVLPSGALLHRQPGRVGADQHGGVPVAVGAVDEEPGKLGVRGRAGDGEQPVRGEQVVGRPGQLHVPAGEHDQPVAEPLQLRDHVRGDQEGQAGVGGRGHHLPHELQPGDRVEAGDRLVEHQQRRALGQRHGQRDLGPLPAGQGLDLAFQRDVQRVHPCLRQLLIPAGVHRPAQVEHVRDAEVAVQRMVLGDVADPRQPRRHGACEVSPKTDTCPSVGSSSPMIISSRVVLPAPFGPTRPATAPAGTSSVQSRSPHTWP